MDLSSISKKILQQPIPFVCGVLVIFLAVLLYMRMPKIEDYQQRHSELERKWQTIQANVDRSNGMEEHVALLEEALEEVETRLMVEENVAVNSEFFYNLEDAVGITLSQFSQGSLNNGERLGLQGGGLKHFGVLPFDLTVSGSLKAMLQFLDTLERSNYLVRTENVVLSLPSRGSTENRDLISGRIESHVLAEKND
jgi:hypothetical protein